MKNTPTGIAMAMKSSVPATPLTRPSPFCERKEPYADFDVLVAVPSLLLFFEREAMRRE